MTTWNQEQAVLAYMKDHHPRVQRWTMREGNDCIWVYWGTESCPINLYFTFTGDAIAKVYID